MNDIEKIIKFTEDETVELGASFKELLNTDLMLGMSDWVIRNGCLSPGHEKLTDSQRYHQSIREMYNLGVNIKSQKALAFEAEADLLDANAMPTDTRAKQLRKKAAILRAELKITSALVTVEDQVRQIKSFDSVRLELKDKVKAKYPGGIEDAEEDNWTAVAEYRFLKKNMGYPENLTHVPLDIKSQTNLGLKLQSPDLMAWAMVTDRPLLVELASQHEKLEKLEGSSHGEQGLLA